MTGPMLRRADGSEVPLAIVDLEMGYCAADDLTEADIADIAESLRGDTRALDDYEFTEVRDGPWGRETTHMRRVLERCRTVLGNMALEDPRPGLFRSRWPIHHEPLREDARNLLPLIELALSEDDD